MIQLFAAAFLLLTTITWPSYADPITPDEVALVVNVYDSTDTDSNGVLDWQDVIDYYAFIHQTWDTSNVIRIRTLAFGPRIDLICPHATSACQPLKYYYRLPWAYLHYDIDTVTTAHYQQLTGLVDTSDYGPINKPANQDYVLQKIAQWFTDGNHWGEIKALAFVMGMPFGMRATHYYPCYRYEPGSCGWSNIVTLPLDEVVSQYLHPGVEDSGGFTKIEPADSNRRRLFFGRNNQLSNPFYSSTYNHNEWTFTPGEKQIVNSLPHSSRPNWTNDTLQIYVLTSRLDGVHVDVVREMIRKAAWPAARYNAATDSVEFTAGALVDGSDHTDNGYSESIRNPWKYYGAFRDDLIGAFGYDGVFHDTVGGNPSGPVYPLNYQLGCFDTPAPSEPIIFYWSMGTHNTDQPPSGPRLSPQINHYWTESLDFPLANGAITAQPESWSAQFIRDTIYCSPCSSWCGVCWIFASGGGTALTAEALLSGFTYAMGNIGEPGSSGTPRAEKIPGAMKIPNNQFAKLAISVCQYKTFRSVSLGDPLGTWLDNIRLLPVSVLEQEFLADSCGVYGVTLSLGMPYEDDLDSLKIWVYSDGAATLAYDDSARVDQQVTFEWEESGMRLDSVVIAVLDRVGNPTYTTLVPVDSIPPLTLDNLEVQFLSRWGCWMDSVFTSFTYAGCPNDDSLLVYTYYDSAGVSSVSLAFQMATFPLQTDTLSWAHFDVWIDSLVFELHDQSGNATSTVVVNSHPRVPPDPPRDLILNFGRSVSAPPAQCCFDSFYVSFTTPDDICLMGMAIEVDTWQAIGNIVFSDTVGPNEPVELGITASYCLLTVTVSLWDSTGTTRAVTYSSPTGLLPEGLQIQFDGAPCCPNHAKGLLGAPPVAFYDSCFMDVHSDSAGNPYITRVLAEAVVPEAEYEFRCDLPGHCLNSIAVIFANGCNFSASSSFYPPPDVVIDAAEGSCCPGSAFACVYRPYIFASLTDPAYVDSIQIHFTEPNGSNGDTTYVLKSSESGPERYDFPWYRPGWCVDSLIAFGTDGRVSYVPADEIAPGIAVDPAVDFASASTCCTDSVSISFTVPACADVDSAFVIAYSDSLGNPKTDGVLSAAVSPGEEISFAHRVGSSRCLDSIAVDIRDRTGNTSRSVFMAPQEHPSFILWVPIAESKADGYVARTDSTFVKARNASKGDGAWGSDITASYAIRVAKKSTYEYTFHRSYFFSDTVNSGNIFDSVLAVMDTSECFCRFDTLAFEIYTHKTKWTDRTHGDYVHWVPMIDEQPQKVTTLSFPLWRYTGVGFYPDTVAFDSVLISAIPNLEMGADTSQRIMRFRCTNRSFLDFYRNMTFTTSPRTMASALIAGLDYHSNGNPVTQGPNADYTTVTLWYVEYDLQNRSYPRYRVIWRAWPKP